MESGADDPSECINCNRPASDCYAVSFDAGRTLEDVFLCRECAEAFADVDFLALESAPKLIRVSEE